MWNRNAKALEHFKPEILVSETDQGFEVAADIEGLEPEMYGTEAEAQMRALEMRTFQATLDEIDPTGLEPLLDRLEQVEAPDANVTFARENVRTAIIQAHSEAPVAADESSDLAVTKAAKRYTLAPVYQPDTPDGHNEMVDADTLQESLWGWVQKGDRTIYLQHSDQPAGEMVEILTWPFEVTTKMALPGEEGRTVTLPADTPYMGVVWEPWAWDLVQESKLRGYSFGGRARKVTLLEGDDDVAKAVSYKPTAGMIAEAKRGLAWRSEGNAGGTAIGVARARDIQNGRNLPLDTVKRMYSFFARHEVDKKAEGFRPGEDGYPSAGRVAWALWGGDAGASWSKAITERAKTEKKLSAAVTEGLKGKADKHNEKYGSTPSKRVNVRMLSAVFERGVGAYRTNPESVRPGVSSPDQWAYARVNAFLAAVRSGRFRGGKFDTDLLPEGHPESTR